MSRSRRLLICSYVYRPRYLLSSESKPFTGDIKKFDELISERKKNNMFTSYQLTVKVKHGSGKILAVFMYNFINTMLAILLSITRWGRDVYGDSSQWVEMLVVLYWVTCSCIVPLDREISKQIKSHFWRLQETYFIVVFTFSVVFLHSKWIKSFLFEHECYL
jgi:hypothetical protein